MASPAPSAADREASSCAFGEGEIPDKYEFAERELHILKLWDVLDAFHTSNKQALREGRPPYSFYDGPPFATGLPHYGHILAGTIKDVVTRYAHQTGHYVERRFGWDCHGLPIEHEIDKALGITGPADVHAMGIDKYNAECRAIVTRYSSEWEQVVTRLGRWIDFKNDYKTLYPWFMESVWWVFSQLYEKGLVYRSFKVMPYSTGCSTPLSNFEANQNYQDVVDPAVFVHFPVDGEENTSFVAWTTTPWTLPSNLALCVNPEFDYVKVRDVATGRFYYVLEKRLEALYPAKKPAAAEEKKKTRKGKDDAGDHADGAADGRGADNVSFEIVAHCKGRDLVNRTYVPLFSYFASRKEHGSFRVLMDGYVTDDSGTGIVHQAPAFGEDDYRICLAAGVIGREDPPPCPVDEAGRFTAAVTDFAGQYVKDADKAIIRMLKENGRLVHQSTITHSYPFCWRSETPLIYKAVPSWFIRVESMVQRLLANNKVTYWVPPFVKEKRFHNWLRDARDWAVSRNRFWGTPIPLWTNEDFSEIVCIHSVDDLAQRSGVRVSDLHRDTVDQITIPSSRPGAAPLRRIPEVFDCWFESGSMPYAQRHYPFENKEAFESSFPAEFIAEGLDQTRGWFYTLLVISTGLFDQPPFKNVVVNGLVLAEDGEKMSKRKRNYPPPQEVVEKYGADALRLYLINSPVVRAESLRFREKGVQDVVKDVLLPWYNAFRFFHQNVVLMKADPGASGSGSFAIDPSNAPSTVNTMDKWILAFTQDLISFVRLEMSAYRLYTVVPRLVQYIDYLTNWYVRSNRRRLKGELGLEQWDLSMRTLFYVLFTMVKLMAPFTPFISEFMYQHLRRHVVATKPLPLGQEDDNASVHYLMVPQPDSSLVDESIVRAVSLMQRVINLSRYLRESRNVPLKYPLTELVVIHREQSALQELEHLRPYVTEEVNVRTLTLSNDKNAYGIALRAEANFMKLGERLKSDMKSVCSAIAKLDDSALQRYQADGFVDLGAHRLEGDDLKIVYTFRAGAGTAGGAEYVSHSDPEVLILVDFRMTAEMRDEGVAREFVNRVQKLRKLANLNPTDPVSIYFEVTADDEETRMGPVMENFNDYIEGQLKRPVRPFADRVPGETVLVDTECSIKSARVHVWLMRPAAE